MPTQSANNSPSGTVSILVNDTLSATPETKQGDVLKATNTLQDNDGLGVISYQWMNDGKDIVGETSATHTVTQADVNKTISVKANYVDLSNTPESVTSKGLRVIQGFLPNYPPTGTVTIKGVSQQNNALSVNDTLADLNGMGAKTYHWVLSDTELNDTKLIKTTEFSTDSSYLLKQSDVGKYISVYASYTDLSGHQNKSKFSPSVKILNVNDLPTGTVSIKFNDALPSTTEFKQGDALKATNTLQDIDGLGGISY